MGTKFENAIKRMKDGKNVLIVALAIALILVLAFAGVSKAVQAETVKSQLETETAKLQQVLQERDTERAANKELSEQVTSLTDSLTLVTNEKVALEGQIVQLGIEKEQAENDKATLKTELETMGVLAAGLDAQNQVLKGEVLSYQEEEAAELAAAEKAAAEAEAALQAEPFDLVAIYSREMAKLLPETNDRKYAARGEDWVGGYVFTLEPDQYQVLFTSEGTISVGDAHYQIEQKNWRENAVVVHNKSDAAVEFRLTGFAPSGFGQWPYRLGTVPDIDEIIWSNVGQGDYCGSGTNTGCNEGVQHDLVFDGTAFYAVTVLWDSPHAVVDNANPIRTADWASVELSAGWDVLMSNLSQPDGEYTVKSPDGVLYLGVTNGRDQVVWLPAGAVVIPPVGEPSDPLEKPTVLVLRNRIGDTVVYKITGITSPVKFLEFRKTAEPADAGQLIVNYTVAQPAERSMFTASASPTSEDAIDLLVLTNE